MLTIILMALSLSVDACAAAVCCGVGTPHFRPRDSLRLGAWFGGFQAGMTLLGALAGSAVSAHLRSLGELAAFALLCYLGGKMLADALAGEAVQPLGDLSTLTVASMALATSLDALAAGVSLVWLGVPLVPSALVIGGVTFCLSAAGGLLGQSVGTALHRWALGSGGVVLIGLGVRILLHV